MEPKDRQVVLITRASFGIGEVTARTLAAAGFRVAIAARRLDRLNTLVDAQTGRQAFTIAADVTDEQQVNTMVAQAHECWGRLDILVNNV